MLELRESFNSSVLGAKEGDSESIEIDKFWGLCAEFTTCWIGV